MDVKVFLAIFNLAHRWALLDGAMVLAAQGSIGLLVIMAMLPNVRPREHSKTRTFVCAGLAVVVAYVTAQVIQSIYPRPRPFAVFGFAPLFKHKPDAAFPSDYAAVALAWATVWILATRSRWLSVAMSAVSGLQLVSRVYAGLHFPSDVLAGAALGIVVALIVWHLRDAIGAVVGRLLGAWAKLAESRHLSAIPGEAEESSGRPSIMPSPAFWGQVSALAVGSMPLARRWSNTGPSTGGVWAHHKGFASSPALRNRRYWMSLAGIAVASGGKLPA